MSALAEGSYSAVYKLQADGMSLGKLERSLQQSADGEYILKSRSYTTGFWKLFVDDTVSEESHFTMAESKVVPKSYHYKKTKKGRLIEERVEFNTAGGEILSSSKDGVQSFPLTGDESDKLLYQYRIRAHLRDGESRNENLNFAVVDRTQLRSYQFEVGQIEEIETSMGRLEVIKVERINEVKRKTTLWFAPSLDYLPVKIVQDADDHSFSSTIISTSLNQ
ncbi:MAG: DUF3108 domain-containing protein [Gammaproteobacteria bacterium]|nr:DUF3108 domain-containing protein [Gammaproteobacteria bacterium]